MRWLAALALLAMAGCVGMPFGPAQPTNYTFDTGGISQTETGLRIDFGRAQAGAIDSASQLFGASPDELALQNGCGIGPVEAARWPGVTLNFQRNSLRGWVLQAPGISANGLYVGMSRAELPAVQLRETSLGTEFEMSGIFGLILPGSDEVALLWSGVSCFFR